MKKRIYTIAFLMNALLFFKSASGQSNENKYRFRAGLSFGAVATDIPGTDSRDNDSDFHKLGFTFGGIVNRALNERNTLQIEINYTQKGSMTPPDSLNNGYVKFSLDYIEVPILLRHKIRINVKKKPVDRLEIEGGASIGRLVRYDFVMDNYAIKVDLTKLNTTEVSLFAGLNFNLTPRLYFCLRYSNSVIPAIKRNSVPFAFLGYSWNNGNNQVILFGVKYVFGTPPKSPASPKESTPPKE